jgi:hypothetical protein
MALTFALGSSTFSDLSRSNLRNALYIRVANGTFQRQRFHLPGVNGNFIIRGGRVGQRIVAAFRYVDTLANVLSAAETDRAAWEDAAVTITDDKSTAYTLCNLESFDRITDPRAIQDSKVFMDCVAIFARDS